MNEIRETNSSKTRKMIRRPTVFEFSIIGAALIGLAAIYAWPHLV